METLETEKPLLKPVSDHSVDMTRRHGRNGVVSILLQPFQWLQMLSSKLNPSFVLGVVLVYGLNQGKWSRRSCSFTWDCITSPGS
ncbi:BnaC02g00080D [Brassica napus]|uniref:BnaC02g00080D protein n=1 Tax=Brassica napus TaxID=3708 RepID=A0A078HQM3_BRANA|nr:BnaC02g00080D [Brassica napus]